MVKSMRYTTLELIVSRIITPLPPLLFWLVYSLTQGSLGFILQLLGLISLRK